MEEPLRQADVAMRHLVASLASRLIRVGKPIAWRRGRQDAAIAAGAAVRGRHRLCQLGSRDRGAGKPRSPLARSTKGALAATAEADPVDDGACDLKEEQADWLA